MTSLKEELARRGWTLKKVVHFKHHDRIVMENPIYGSLWISGGNLANWLLMR